MKAAYVAVLCLHCCTDLHRCMHADTFVYVIWAGEGVIRVYILERVSSYLYMSRSGQDRTNIYIYIYMYICIYIYIYMHA